MASRIRRQCRRRELLVEVRRPRVGDGLHADPQIRGLARVSAADESGGDDGGLSRAHADQCLVKDHTYVHIATEAARFSDLSERDPG